MNRHPVQSENLKSAGYDEKERVLEVEFHKGNKLYQYQNVPREAYLGLIGSSSPGKFFTVMIRGKYSYRLVDMEKADASE